MKATSLSYQDRLRLVLQHIEGNLDTPPSLEELSRIACFSPYHFHRIFTAMMGESVAAYVRRLLLQRAAAHLSYSGEAITTVALVAGYDSLDAFTRAFRAAFGASPSVYRRNGGSLAAAARQSTGVFKRCGVVLLGKTLIPALLVIVYGNIFGREGILGVSLIAAMIAFTNSNGGLWLALAGQYGKIDTAEKHLLKTINCCGD